MSVFVAIAFLLSLVGGVGVGAIAYRSGGVVRAWWQMALLIVGFTLLFSLFLVGWAISPGGG